MSPTPDSTAFAGKSLKATLYDFPLTIGLIGHLGAGKTSFLQGFLKTLGVSQAIVSPTYALEQRYTTTIGEVLHIDLYRLDEKAARQLLAATDDHPGLRCVEWYDRISEKRDEPQVVVRFDETSPTERSISCTFEDTPLITDAVMRQWQRDVIVPPHVAAHCSAVAALTMRFADALIARGHIIRRETLREAAIIHDLFRFLDFRPGAGPKEYEDPPGAPARWEALREEFSGIHHEQACARFLRINDFPVHAAIVATHGLRGGATAQSTVEQKLLYYGDKRVKGDEVVSLDERFRDFAERYGGGTPVPEAKGWFDEVKAVESSLFPEGVPF